MKKKRNESNKNFMKLTTFLKRIYFPQKLVFHVCIGFTEKLKSFKNFVNSRIMQLYFHGKSPRRVIRLQCACIILTKNFITSKMLFIFTENCKKRNLTIFLRFFQMIVVIRQAVIVKTAPVWTVSAIVTMGMEAKAAICLMTMSANIGRVTYLGKYRLQWPKYKHVLFQKSNLNILKSYLVLTKCEILAWQNWWKLTS